MSDPISTRNTIVQTSIVEKIQQVQKQQGDLHQRYMANPKVDEVEKKTKTVQTSQESAETKIRDQKNQNEHGGKKGRRSSGGDLEKENEREPLDAESDTGRIVDIKV